MQQNLTNGYSEVCANAFRALPIALGSHQPKMH